MSRVLNGRYRLDEVIGSGATATIWRAWDTRLDRSVAVKLLDGPGLGIDRDEARTLARLSHPGIVAIFDSGVDGDDEYLVMELVEGRSVSSRLADGVFPINDAAAVMAQVCDALAAAHISGVVHRDVKPGNILLGPAGTVKVCDFGIARQLDTTSRTAGNIALGTASYMSPEQVAGRPVDGRADLYAVGCVLFQMLTGDAPFAGETALSIADQQMHNQPPTVRSRRPEVPPGLDSLVGRLLAKDPDDRPASAAAVGAELRTWAVPPVLTVAATPRRRPYARLGLATVAALALPAALVTMWPEKDRIPPSAGIASTSPGASPPLSGPWTPSPRPSAFPRPSTSPLVTGPASPARTSPSPPPPPSRPPAPPAVPEQIADLQALIRQLADTGQLPKKNADELVHLLDDLENLIGAGKQQEAADKLAAIRKKNDDLLAGGKISAAGHTQIDTRLDALAVAVSAMSARPSPTRP